MADDPTITYHMGQNRQHSMFECMTVQYTCNLTSDLDDWFDTTSLILRISPGVIPPTTYTTRSGWLLGLGPAELLNRLSKNGNVGVPQSISKMHTPVVI